MKNFTAPDLATMEEWAQETGETIHRGYKLVRTGHLPHLRQGDRGVRIVMPAYRRMIRGEPVDSSLFEGKPATIKEHG